MSRDEILFDRPFDEHFVRTLETLLVSAFGCHFELWLPGDGWRPLQLSPDMRILDARPSESVGKVLAKCDGACRGPVFGESADGWSLAIPVHRKRELAIVATTSEVVSSPENRKLCEAFLREIQLREELELERAANDAHAIETSRSLEEMFLFRQLAEHLDVSEMSEPSSELTESTMSLLREAIGAESLVWVGYQTEQADSARLSVRIAKIVADAGTRRFDRDIAEFLIARYASLATMQPAVDNHVQASVKEAASAGISQLMLSKVAVNGSQFGWILAVNRRPAEYSDSGNLRSFLDPNSREFGSVEAGLLGTVASILASHSRNVELFQEKESMFFGAVRSLVNAIDAKDQYTRGHSERVGLYARRLGEELGLGIAACKRLYLCGLLHDVGKIGIQDSTLRKTGKLTEQEFADMRRHPHRGWEILYELDRLQHVLPAVVHHHERWDGKGYPDGLAGEDIPREARIMAVADTYDALTSDRPYRLGMSQDKAEAILRDGAGTQWDPQVIEAMLQAMAEIICISREYRPGTTAERPVRPDSGPRVAPLLAVPLVQASETTGSAIVQ